MNAEQLALLADADDHLTNAISDIRSAQDHLNLATETLTQLGAQHGTTRPGTIFSDIILQLGRQQHRLERRRQTLIRFGG